MFEYTERDFRVTGFVCEIHMFVARHPNGNFFYTSSDCMIEKGFDPAIIKHTMEGMKTGYESIGYTVTIEMLEEKL